MSYTPDLAAGHRELLLANGITPVVIGPIPANQLGAVVGLTPYPLQDNDLTGQILTGLQVRIKGSPTAGVASVLDLQDRIRDLFCSQTARTVGGVTIALAWRQMSAPLGLDAQGRPEVVDTYYLRSDRVGLTG